MTYSFPAIALLSILSLGCMSAEPGTPGTATDSEVATQEEPVTTTFRVLDRGAYAQAARGENLEAREPFVEVATSSADYDRLWNSLIGEGSAPAVDFAKESAVFLMLGIRSSGGHGIEPVTAELDGSVAVVRARRIAPAKGDMTTQAITAPYVVIAIAKPQLTAVEWREPTGEVVVEHRR